jgi:predicted DNA-binding protein (UPF0278 family)
MDSRREIPGSLMTILVLFDIDAWLRPVTPNRAAIRVPQNVLY